MTVTIIMPVYNDPHIERAIKSVLGQKFDDWKLEILNNGCTDPQTIDTINKYDGCKGVTVHNYPTNRQSECGALFAMGVETEHLAFLFSDDQWHSSFLEKMMDGLGENEFVFCNTQIVDEKGAPWKKIPETQFDGDITSMDADGHLQHMFMHKNTLHPCAMLAKTYFYKLHKGFSPVLHRVGDMAFFARILYYGDVSFIKDKLAFITCNSIRSGKKNQSFGNDKLSLEMMVERSRFLKVFADHLPPIRLFELGIKSLKNPAPDYIFFGWKCIYDSIDTDYEGINALTLEKFNLSVGEYIKKLQQRMV